ncbi:toll/interleukin-1 receptor domain-containing protein [Leptolyngbya sp. FACHB-541]|uniref:toll/interleukin-1 receptor domain-containing protein n=1 Tax=Leptolyngbya sp. FACHB-541 TaxID=2692810 RepID=UPI0016889481|nr:toll/interleukin-1 receptor domain-containing protein [Leptolyngbya sp. FACHB-541]MBD1996855.1 toll/interleukin-1 receptor domain-containing protein [Leptolyngbya sp. FACHB-541]
MSTSTPSTATQASLHQVKPQNDAFISYSRRDKAFVEKLDATLRRLNRNPWVDWEDIYKGEEWWKAIQRGIESANTFIFVVSPDSVASAVCRDEVTYAAECNKRFLPIVWREGFDPQLLHPAIASHNWIFFRETDDFNQSLQELIQAMDTDLDHLRAHTRLLMRALEWQNKAQNSSYLLRGHDLQEAEQWLMQGLNKNPKPTALQTQYINSSGEAEALALKARQKAKWIVVLTTILVNMVLVTGACFWLYNSASGWARRWVERQLQDALNVGLVGIDGDEFEAIAYSPPSPTNEVFYQNHQDWLVKVNTALPTAFPRTYAPTANPDEIIWVGDSLRDITNNAASQPISATRFRQPYTVDSASQYWLAAGLIEPTITQSTYTDQFGSWLSISGPIQNSAGQVVGGLRVDFRANYVQQIEQRVRNALFSAYIFVFIWFFILSLIILRVTRPLTDSSSLKAAQSRRNNPSK